MSTTRTRFAPSPTGYIHVGNLRSAIYPWLIARQNGGEFVLRIEDTDQERLVDGATQLIMDTLAWLGINHDEGLDVGGNYGPYIQTERKDIYQKWAQKLIDKGHAYADPYSQAEVQAFREQAKVAKKAFLYRDYRPKNPPRWDGSQPLRFKVTDVKRYTWNDPVMGELSAGPEALDDFILVKSDGLPTYNFAHIVDDAEMKITHVIRGQEYVASIPKYLSLYDALGLEWPVLACLPHIMAPGGNKKLGKRDGAKGVSEYRDQGILPEAMFNFLAGLGWNDGTEQEIFTKDELISKFSLDRVQKAGAQFDEQRLLWMNGTWIRSLSLDDLYARCADFWPANADLADDTYKKAVLSLVQERLKYFAELPELTNFFFEEPTVNLLLITDSKQLSKFELGDLNTMLTSAKTALDACDFTPEALTETLNALLVATGQKPGVLFSLIRIATTWAPASPALAESLAVLGKDTALKRLDIAIENIR